MRGIRIRPASAILDCPPPRLATIGAAGRLKNRPFRNIASAYCFGITAILMFAQSPVAAQPLEILQGHKGSIYGLANSSDGRVLVSAGADHLLKFWRTKDKDVDQRERQHRQALLAQLDADRFAVRQNAYEQLMKLGVAMKEELLVHAKESPSAEVRFRARRLLAMANIPQGIGHSEEVRDVTVSSDGGTAVSAGRDNMIGFWNVAQGRATTAVNGHADGVWSVTFSPDCQHVASGGGDHLVKIWSAKDRTVVAEFKGHEGTIHDLAFSADGDYLASAGGFDRTIRIWAVATGHCCTVLDGHKDAVMCLAFSSDGKMIASGGYDGHIYLWDVESGRLIRSFAAHRGVIRDLAFSPRRANHLITAGDDRTVKRWNIKTGEMLQPIRTHGDGVTAIAVASDGATFAAATRDGTIRRWPMVDDY